MKYLVVGFEGPGFASPEEAAKVLESTVIPSFDALIKLEAEKKILAGGLPVGDRAFTFIVEAPSNDEVDRLLRGPPDVGGAQVAGYPAPELPGARGGRAAAGQTDQGPEGVATRTTSCKVSVFCP